MTLLARARVTALVVLAFFGLAHRAQADERPRAAFALIVGANVSVDHELAPLHYADDDAARYFDLFRLLGMRTVILARIDDSTRKLHSQAAAEAQLPRKDAFERATAQLAGEVAQARQRGLETTLYFVFAGHGGVDESRGYVSLEDARLTGEALGTGVVSRIGAGSTHMIIDACNSYLLAYSRGPGGSRRPVHDFVQSVYELGRDQRVGLLLSTSSATESHEWDAFQAGVFSHEVRSGLYGTADANGDGSVSYREIAAFVGRANQAVVNDRYRPHLFARAPANDERLLDLRTARGRLVTVDGAHAGRYLLEDARGVRLADFHNAPGQDATFVRPGPSAQAYLRRLDDESEFTLPPGDGPLRITEMTPEHPRVAARGALHESFSRIFSLPFDRASVDAYQPSAPPEPDRADAPAIPIRGIVGWSLIGLGAAGAGMGSYFALRSASESKSPAGESQADVATRNFRVGDANLAATWSFVGGGVAAIAGAAVLLWPSRNGGRLQALAFQDGAYVGYAGMF